MYLALMEATLGNYKMEKQAFIPLWKEFSFPNGSFKKKKTTHFLAYLRTSLQATMTGISLQPGSTRPCLFKESNFQSTPLLSWRQPVLPTATRAGRQREDDCSTSKTAAVNL